MVVELTVVKQGLTVVTVSVIYIGVKKHLFHTIKILTLIYQFIVSYLACLLWGIGQV